MKATHIVSRVLVAAAMIAATTSCGSVVRDSRSPVFLVIAKLGAAPGAPGATPTQFSSNLLSSVITLATSPPPCTTSLPCHLTLNDPGSVDLTIALKDIGAGSATAPAPTTNNAVTVTRYHVEFVRTDGRNTPGVDVPFPFDGASTATVTGSATTTLGFNLVPNNAKVQAPLVQLILSPTVLSTIANVTFYGTDQVGNAVSVTGSISVDFGDFGDIAN